ncbi:MAG TPA: hypothetical protein VNU97_19590 [Rhizomicrobium sp.]|jgi:hypothetical protein|nr:hypothetical protein [Rhizomicrobium sp.]
MVDKPPNFEMHILPMIRAVDRAHMLGDLDLYDYDVVKAYAQRILAHLQGTPDSAGVGAGGQAMMPPQAYGGPWPRGWIQTFSDWASGSFPRRAYTKGSYTAQRFGDGTVQVEAIVTVPNDDDGAWLEPLSTSGGEAKFALYYRPGTSGKPASLTSDEMAAKDTKTVVIVDSNGPQSVPIS